ncbi:MAG TPA: acyl-CoA dehydrogenase family protein [Candidatus Binataceae bacterium]|nr:acyl-CoA dehydrogenase family protein [Candidatus Binataceae bacterium]
MDFGLSEEQEQLRVSAREFLSNECATTFVRKVMASGDGAASELYAHIAKLGWHGLIIPEKFGGAGLTMLDMAVLLEEQGYAAMPGPFLFSSVIAASALKEFGTDAMKQKWLPAMAEGKVFGTIALAEEDDGIEPVSIRARASRSGTEAVLNGRKMFVPYANTADFIIVAARTGDALDDVRFFVVDSKSSGVTITMLKGLDLTRRVCALDLKDVRVNADAELQLGKECFRRIIDVASVAVAADSLGGAQRALEMAVEYSKVREQFGKPIGSFQALKHAASEIVSELEPARSLLWYAAYALDTDPKASPRAAAMAKARLCEVYSRTTDKAVLMHGGIGFTWEHDIHLWFKRSRFNESYFGSPPYHRERVAQLGGY